MTLRAYLKVLAERWKVILLVVVLSTGISVLVTVATAKVYQADAQIFVASTQQSDNISFEGAAFTQAQAQTFAKIAASDDIVKKVLADTHVRLSTQDLKSKITATAPTGQSIIDLQVRDSSPARSALLANSTAKFFVSVIEGYYTTNGSGGGRTTSAAPPLRLHITESATTPTDPVSPNPVFNIALGVALGLLVGIALAVALDILDNRIKDPETLAEKAGKPLLGVIVEDPGTARNPLANRAGPRNARAENIRQLRTNLQFADIDEHPRVLGVASSVADEGKTMVAMNLAAALAEAGFRVCLVDADLRRPGITETLGLVNPAGLTSVLINQVALDDALQKAGPNLLVLGAGPPPPNPSELLASSYIREIMRSLLERVDYVVIDTAPLLPLADGAEVAALADGTLLVARYKTTTENHVRRSVEVLDRVDGRLLGVVLNRIPSRRGGEYGSLYFRPDTDVAAHSANGDHRSRSRRETDATRS